MYLVVPHPPTLKLSPFFCWSPLQVIPAVQSILAGEDGADMVDEGLELLTLLTFYTNAPPSPEVWAMWPYLMQCIR